MRNEENELKVSVAGQRGCEVQKLESWIQGFWNKANQAARRNETSKKSEKTICMLQKSTI
jgi:hypothetical protein